MMEKTKYKPRITIDTVTLEMLKEIADSQFMRPGDMLVYIITKIHMIGSVVLTSYDHLHKYRQDYFEKDGDA